MITFILKMINANSCFYTNNKRVKIFIASNANHRLTETQSEQNKQNNNNFFSRKKNHLVISVWRGDVISGKI